MAFAELDRNQIEEQDICPRACRDLWAAVILEQWTLAVAPRYADRPYATDSARRWFGSRDFRICCALAGLDGDWVAEGVRREIAAREAAQ